MGDKLKADTEKDSIHSNPGQLLLLLPSPSCVHIIIGLALHGRLHKGARLMVGTIKLARSKHSKKLHNKRRKNGVKDFLLSLKNYLQKKSTIKEKK